MDSPRIHMAFILAPGLPDLGIEPIRFVYIRNLLAGFGKLRCASFHEQFSRRMAFRSRMSFPDLPAVVFPLDAEGRNGR